VYFLSELISVQRYKFACSDLQMMYENLVQDANGGNMASQMTCFGISKLFR